jgi:hypothetical protein
MTTTDYTIEPLPPVRPDETEWLVTGGSQPYTVRRNWRGEFRCTCPHHKFRLGNRSRDGFQCKHASAVIDSLNVDAMLQEAYA